MENTPKVVRVKKISRPGSLGITAFSKSVTVLGCAITKNGHNTGLTEQEEKEFEKALKLKEGDLSKHSEWWDNVFNTEHAIMLNNTKPTEFILDNPINKLRYKVLLASMKVANSEIERAPYNDFYIDDQEAKDKADNTVFEYKMEGMEAILKMTVDQKRDALRLFGKTGVDNTEEYTLKVDLNRFLEKDPKKFIETINDKDIRTRAFVLELIERHILTRKGSDFKYNDDFIGSSIEACILYFDTAKNQDLKLHLRSKLDKAKKTS